MKRIVILAVLAGVLTTGCGIDNNIRENIKSPDYPNNKTAQKSINGSKDKESIKSKPNAWESELSPF